MTTPAPPRDAAQQAARLLAGVFTAAGVSQADADGAARAYIAEAGDMLRTGHYTAASADVAGQAAWNPGLHPRGPGGQFGTGSGGQAAPTNQHPVGEGETGQRVRDLQNRLNALGAKPPLKVDGIFGEKTLAAVKAYQQARGLKVDGLVGPLTTAALRSTSQGTKTTKPKTAKPKTTKPKTTSKTRPARTTKKTAAPGHTAKNPATRKAIRTGAASTAKKTAPPNPVKPADRPGSVTSTQKAAVNEELKIRALPAKDAKDFSDDLNGLSQNDATALLTYIRNHYQFKAAAPGPYATLAALGADLAAAFREDLHPRGEGGKWVSLDERSGGRHAGPGSFEHIRSIRQLADEIDTSSHAGGTGQSETAAALRNVARHVGLRQLDTARQHMQTALAAARREKLPPAQIRDLRAISASLRRVPKGTVPEPGFGEHTRGEPAPWSLQSHSPAGPGYRPGLTRHAGADPAGGEPVAAGTPAQAATPAFYTDKAGVKHKIPARPKPGKPVSPAQQQADEDTYARQLAEQIDHLRAQMADKANTVPRDLLQAMLDHLTEQLAAVRHGRPATTAAAAPDPQTAAMQAITDLGLDADAAELALEIAEWNYFANGGTVEAAESAGWQRNKGNASHLHDYWAFGEGAAKIGWGTPGDWYRCRDLLRKYIADPEGYCEKMHKERTGMTTSQHAEEDRGGKKATAAEVLAFNPFEHRGRHGEWDTGGTPGAIKISQPDSPHLWTAEENKSQAEFARRMQNARHGAQPPPGSKEHSAQIRALAAQAAQVHPAAGAELRAAADSVDSGDKTAAQQHLTAAYENAAADPQFRDVINDHMSRLAGWRPGTNAAAGETGALPALVTIPGVDILAAGTWQLSTGRQTFTAKDLQSAIDASSCPAVGPPVIKIGHLDPRFTPQPEHDGEPAIGRVTNLRLSGNGTKIIGDLAGMPGWLGSIAASAFPRRSVEGKYGFTCQVGHQHPFVLTGLALLGVTPPGVGVLSGLPDIASLYGLTAASAQAGQAWRTEQDQEGTVMAVTEEDVRRAYYATAGAPQTWWITELQMSPPQLIVADEGSGKIYRVAYRLDGAAVSFDQAQEVASYADVAATRGTGPVIAFASAAASRTVTAAGQAKPWDADAQVSALGDDPPPAAVKAMFALPGDSKTGSKLPHHNVSGGQVGAPNPIACTAAIAALNGGRGGMKGVSPDQAKAAYNHLAAHLRAMGRTPPEFSAASPAGQNRQDPDQAGRGYGDVYAAPGDTDADDTTQGLIASLDATLDEAAAQAAQVDPQQVPEQAAQAMSLITAAETIVDQLMDQLSIYDPDDAGTDTDDDAGTDETTQNLVAGLDATLDQAAACAAQVDPQQVPGPCGQALALAIAARAIVDQLMDQLGIYDPDDQDGTTNAANAAAGTGPPGGAERDGDAEPGTAQEPGSLLAAGGTQAAPGTTNQDEAEQAAEDQAGFRHGPADGEHEHPHPAYGSQGGDATHSHPHQHAGDARHNHSHDTQAAAPAAAATQEEGISGMGYEFTTQQMAAIRARLGKKDGEQITASDIAGVFGAPQPPFPVQAAVAGTSGEGPVEVPAIADGVHLVEANILRKYQEEALAGRRAVRAMIVAERDQVLAAAIKEGKFAQTRLDHFKQLWDRDPDGTRKLVASLAGGLVPMQPIGSNGEWATDPDMPGDFDAQKAYRDLYPEDTKGGVTPAPGVRAGY